MDKYLIMDIIHTLTPFLGNTLSMLTGIIITNIFWKSRIHRYAKTEVVETLEYQKNKIEYLEQEIREKKEIISMQKGSIKAVRLSALKILEAIK